MQIVVLLVHLGNRVCTYLYSKLAHSVVSKNKLLTDRPISNLTLTYITYTTTRYLPIYMFFFKKKQRDKTSWKEHIIAISYLPYFLLITTALAVLNSLHI